MYVCTSVAWLVLARVGPGSQCRGLGCVANMAADPSPGADGMDPKVKTRSVERALLPLVTQVSDFPR